MGANKILFTACEGKKHWSNDVAYMIHYFFHRWNHTLYMRNCFIFIEINELAKITTPIWAFSRFAEWRDAKTKFYGISCRLVIRNSVLMGYGNTFNHVGRRVSVLSMPECLTAINKSARSNKAITFPIDQIVDWKSGMTLFRPLEGIKKRFP